MPRVLLALAVTLAACASTAPDGTPAMDLPVGSWTGLMIQDGVGLRTPANLSVEPDGRVTLVVGAARVSADDVSYEDARLRFRCPQFPVSSGDEGGRVSRVQRRALRCDLSDDRPGGLRGTCRAGQETYGLVLRPTGVGR